MSSTSSIRLRCGKCGCPIESGTYVDGVLVCSFCLKALQPKHEQNAMPSNWCPVHGSYAYYLQRCPGCESNPPGIKIITTSSSEDIS